MLRSSAYYYASISTPRRCVTVMIRERNGPYSRYIVNNSTVVPPLYKVNPWSSCGISFAPSRRHSLPSLRASEKAVSHTFWPRPLQRIDQIPFVDARSVLASPPPVRCKDQEIQMRLGDQLEALKCELEALEFRLQALLSLRSDSSPRRDSTAKSKNAEASQPFKIIIGDLKLGFGAK